MLRKIRLTFAMICFALITLLFLDFTGTLHGWFGWLAKIQFLPAVLALNVGVILFLVILTLVCGRIYCSVICPLGVFQDILAWLGRQPKGEFYQFNLSSCIRQQNSLTAQFVSFSFSNLANIFYTPPNFYNN